MFQEEGGYEYISDSGGRTGTEEAHPEPGVLYQPLEPEADGDLGALRVCKAGAIGPCARDTSATCNGRHNECHGNSTGHRGHRGGSGKVICGAIEVAARGKGCGVENPEYGGNEGAGEGEGDGDGGSDGDGGGGGAGGHRLP